MSTSIQHATPPDELVRCTGKIALYLKHYRPSHKEPNYSATTLKLYQFLRKKPYYSSGLAWDVGDEIIQLRCKNAARPAAEGENALRDSKLYYQGTSIARQIENRLI
ncbi:MAG: hypothetical protein RIF39_15475 [Cyclobacteriaceae bacterium]